MFDSLLLLLLSHFSRVRLCVIPQTAATRLHRPWDSPDKNTGVGCHFLLQCRKGKSEREVAQSCLTLSDPMDCSPSGSSVHGIFQARVLEWSEWLSSKKPEITYVDEDVKKQNTSPPIMSMRIDDMIAQAIMKMSTRSQQIGRAHV